MLHDDWRAGQVSLSFQAMQFAREVHQGHVRKYTGAPYVDHLAEVVGIVSTVADTWSPENMQIIVATAWLHDCVEEQGVAPSLLWDMFGSKVTLGVLALSDTMGVLALSDMEQGNRATRKRLSRERLALAPDWIQTIKCADLISNTPSIVKHDPTFATVYLQEKRELLAVLTKADKRLWELARQPCEPSESATEAECGPTSRAG